MTKEEDYLRLFNEAETLRAENERLEIELVAMDALYRQVQEKLEC